MSVKGDTIYNFSANDINENEVSFRKYQNNNILIINFSSKDVQAIDFVKVLKNIKLKYSDLKIVLFPCSQFGVTEATSDLMNFLNENHVPYDDLYQEIEVNGSKASPLYKFLKTRLPSNMGGFINCNFTVFIINKNGEPIQRFSGSKLWSKIEENIPK